MATIRAKLLDNLQHKLHPNCNYMITRFGLLICSAFFILITLLILLTTTNTSTPTLYTSSIVSWSYNLPNTSLYSSSVRNSSTLLPNLTKSYDLGNFSKEEKKSHLENLDFLVKNVSFFGQESRKGDIFTVSSEKNGVGLGQIDAELGQLPNFTKSFDLGNFSRKTHLGNPDFLVKNVSFLGQESRKGDIFNVSSGKNEVGLGQIDGRLGQLHKDEVGFRSIKCDIFDGKWVKDERMPHYPPGSCPFVDNDFNCHINRRPDHDFYRWKWQPHQCNIPRLNATDFLERMRGRKLVFVGDSLNRNMWESLVCILRHSVKDKRRVHEISGKREFKKEGFYAFRFEDYNCTIDYVRAPFLVREWTFQGKNGPLPTLRLDLMDQTTKMYHDADILIFNTGHWWTHEKTSRGEDYYQEGNHLHPRLKALQAYGRALRTWGRWVDRLVDPKKTLVFFRGYSGTHFRGGQWNSGGQCHKETEPIFNETYLGKYPSKMRVLEQVMQKMKTPVMYLNISRLTDYRKDAHPSIYRKSYKNAKELIEAEQSQDCSHWCLPGVPDIWNELLYASLLKAGLKPVNP